MFEREEFLYKRPNLLSIETLFVNNESTKITFAPAREMVLTVKTYNVTLCLFTLKTVVVMKHLYGNIAFYQYFTPACTCRRRNTSKCYSTVAFGCQWRHHSSDWTISKCDRVLSLGQDYTVVSVGMFSEQIRHSWWHLEVLLLAGLNLGVIPDRYTHIFFYKNQIISCEPWLFLNSRSIFQNFNRPPP